MDYSEEPTFKSHTISVSIDNGNVPPVAVAGTACPVEKA